MLYAQVSDFTLVGELDAEFTYRETFVNVLQEMLSNFLKRVATPSVPTGSLWLDIKVSVEIILADWHGYIFQKHKILWIFTLPRKVNSSNFKRLYPC